MGNGEAGGSGPRTGGGRDHRYTVISIFIVWVVIVLAAALVVVGIQCRKIEAQLRRHDALIDQLNELAGQRSERLEDMRAELESLVGRQQGRRRHLRGLVTLPVAGATWVAREADKRPIAAVAVVAGIAAALLGLAALRDRGDTSPRRQGESVTAAPTTSSATTTIIDSDAPPSPGIEVATFPPEVPSDAGQGMAEAEDGAPAGADTGSMAPVPPSAIPTPTAPDGASVSVPTTAPDPPSARPPTTSPPPTSPPTTSPPTTSASRPTCLLALNLLPLVELELLCA